MNIKYTIFQKSISIEIYWQGAPRLEGPVALVPPTHLAPGWLRHWARSVGRPPTRWTDEVKAGVHEKAYIREWRYDDDDDNDLLASCYPHVEPTAK